MRDKLIIMMVVAIIFNTVINLIQDIKINKIRTEQKMVLKEKLSTQLLQLEIKNALDNTTYAVEPTGPTYEEKTFFVTAYCPCEKCCGNFADGITSNGHKIIDGDRFVAAPKSFAFGTIMDIPGYGTVAVKDRGGAIKGNKLDVFFNTHQEALNWGVKRLTVTVFYN